MEFVNLYWLGFFKFVQLFQGLGQIIFREMTMEIWKYLLTSVIFSFQFEAGLQKVTRRSWRFSTCCIVADLTIPTWAQEIRPAWDIHPVGRYTISLFLILKAFWIKVHFMEPPVLSVSDFGWLCPRVSKSGWIHRRLCSSVTCAMIPIAISGCRGRKLN